MLNIQFRFYEEFTNPLRAVDRVVPKGFEIKPNQVISWSGTYAQGYLYLETTRSYTDLTGPIEEPEPKSFTFKPKPKPCKKKKAGVGKRKLIID